MFVDKPDDADLRERLRGFFAHAETHLERGNMHAVREALDDARRLLGTAGYEEPSQ